MKKIIENIKANLEKIQRTGAFIFDIDNTLVLPDDSFENYPELICCLKEMLAQRIRIAFVSGSPGAVIENRISLALAKENIDVGALTVYANGGSAKFKMDTDFIFEQIEGYGRDWRISKECLDEVKELLTRYVCEGFGLEDGMIFEKVKEVWFRKRMEQWGSLPIDLDDTWVRGGEWQINFLDDKAMAQVKAKKGSAKTTFPFINIRQAKYGLDQQLQSCSSFSPTGFYSLKEKNKDGVDLDLRDWVIENLKKDLKEWGEDLNFYKAGRSTIDVTHFKLSKASAVEDFVVSNRFDPNFVYYFGDEFFEGGNDNILAQEEFLKKVPIQLIAVNQKDPKLKNISWVGTGPTATLNLLKGIFIHETTDESL